MHHLLVAARAAGLSVIDGPYAGIHDADGLRTVSTMAAALGYDGKWVLHPDQVGIVNTAFTPTKESYDQAKQLVAAYRESLDSQGRGAMMHGEIMVDEASAKMALGIIQRGEAAGYS